MIRHSLIVGTLWYALSRAWDALRRSAPGRGFEKLCAWLGRAWRASLFVNLFCTPRYASGEREREPGRVRAAAARLYEKIGLRKLVSGSMFLHGFLWCAAAAALAPLLPTMGVLALTLVGFGTAALRALHEPERRLHSFPLRRLVVLYAALYLIGTLTSVDRGGSMLIGVLTIVFVGFCAVLYDAVDTRAQLDALIAALVTVAAGVSCYAILQYMFKWGYQSSAWVDNDMFSTIQFRVSGTLQNPNMFGEYLVLMIPLGGAKLLSVRGTWRRLYYLACCGVMCAAMILTFSRGAWLGLLFAGLAFFVILRPRLLFLAPFALLALWFVLPETVVERFASIGNLGDHSTSYRVSIWLGTIAMLRDGYWLFGIGPGESAFNKIYPFYSYHEVVAPHSHNLFLQIVCDAGVFALLVFLWILLRYFRTLGAALWREEDKTSRVLQTAFVSGMLGFLVQAMTDYSFYNYRVMLLFWAYLAAGALCARRSAMKEGGVL